MAGIDARPIALLRARSRNVAIGWKAAITRDNLYPVKGMLWGRAGMAIVAVLLGLQLVLLYLSLGPLDTMSVFCAGPSANLYATIIGSVHLAFLVLFIVGLFALRFPALRLVYALLLAVGLCALPVQAHLVSTGELHCDAP